MVNFSPKVKKSQDLAKFLALSKNLAKFEKKLNR